MYCWILTFDMVPEKMKEGDEWLESVGLTFWARQECVTGVSLLRVATSSFPRRAYLIDITSMDELQKVLNSPERQETVAYFFEYVTNVSSTTMEVITRSEKC
ncbi:hypothetical protein ACFLUE_01545 [Chloroflexota bacterium]